jgi:general stress protein YciG
VICIYFSILILQGESKTIRNYLRRQRYRKMEEEANAVEIEKAVTPASKRQITVAEAGQRGGMATFRNRGPAFFKSIGREGGRRTAELYGSLLREFGRQGGRPKRPALGKSMLEKHRE